MPATDRSLELARAAAHAADDKLATTIVGIDVSEQLAITDAFLLVSATNERQVGAIVDAVEDALREIGSEPIRREGQRDGRWVLLDYGEIVVHVQQEEERQPRDFEQQAQLAEYAAKGFSHDFADRHPDARAGTCQGTSPLVDDADEASGSAAGKTGCLQQHRRKIAARLGTQAALTP